MKNTRVVNIYKDYCDVYIGRAGKGHDGYFGNPVVLGRVCPVCYKVHNSRGSTLECYKKYFYDRIERDLEFKHKILELKGKRLGCFCKPNPCHGDVITQYIEEQD